MISMEDVKEEHDTGRRTVNVFEKIGGCHEH